MRLRLAPIRLLLPIPRRGRDLLRRLYPYRVILLFLAGLWLIDVLIGQFASTWQHYAPDDYQARVERCRAIAPDLLVIGGSPVSEGIDPQYLMDWQSCDRPYALGLPGATVSELWHAIQRGIITPPRVLIYGCTASDWNDRRHEPMGPHSLMTWHDLAVWLQHRPESAEWITRHFMQSRLAKASNLFHYRRGVRLWGAAQLEPYFPGSFPESSADARDGAIYSTAIATSNGYAPNPRYIHRRYDHIKIDEPPPADIPHLRRYTLGSHLRYLNWILDWADEHSIRVIFVDMPVTEDLEVRMHPQEFARYRERLAEIAAERGGTILSASRSRLELTDADFADVIHLNGAGAAKLSRWLRTQLESLP